MEDIKNLENLLELVAIIKDLSRAVDENRKAIIEHRDHINKMIMVFKDLAKLNDEYYNMFKVLFEQVKIALPSSTTKAEDIYI